MESKFRGFEEENPPDNDNTVAEYPVIPGTNLPVQTEAVVPEKPSTDDAKTGREPEPENLRPDLSLTEETRVADPTVLIGPVTGLDEDPRSPKIKTPPSNYQTKVTDPTAEGGKEAKIDPSLLEGVGRLHLRDQSLAAGDRVESDKAVGSDKKPAAEFGQKAAVMLAPVYEKVVGAGSSVSKFVREGYVAMEESGGGVSVRGYLAEKLSPGEEDKELSETILGTLRKKEVGAAAAGRVGSTAAGDE